MSRKVPTPTQEFPGVEHRNPQLFFSNVCCKFWSESELRLLESRSLQVTALRLQKNLGSFGIFKSR
jgi:hypothetical protein